MTLLVLAATGALVFIEPAVRHSAILMLLGMLATGLRFHEIRAHVLLLAVFIAAMSSQRP
jgi:hypothetical protein